MRTQKKKSKMKDKLKEFAEELKREICYQNCEIAGYSNCMHCKIIDNLYEKYSKDDSPQEVHHKELVNLYPEDTSKKELCECGHTYLEHSCSNDDGSFNKDKEGNPLHLGFCHYCDCKKFKPSKKEKEVGK